MYHMKFYGAPKLDQNCMSQNGSKFASIMDFLHFFYSKRHNWLFFFIAGPESVKEFKPIEKTCRWIHKKPNFWGPPIFWQILGQIFRKIVQK